MYAEYTYLNENIGFVLHDNQKQATERVQINSTSGLAQAFIYSFTYLVYPRADTAVGRLKYHGLENKTCQNESLPYGKTFIHEFFVRFVTAVMVIILRRRRRGTELATRMWYTILYYNKERNQYPIDLGHRRTRL